jgi:RNA polymerase sigma-70 factor (ECF subfamily)
VPASSPALSDADLVEGIRCASEWHFNRLYERYFQRVYNFTYVRVRNHADTEEIVQETFTAVFRSIEAFRGQSSLLSWIYGIAKNTVNNHLRRSKARDAWLERAEPDLSGPVASTPEEELSLRRYADAIHKRLGSVADWQAEVFVLRHIENLPIREIAKRTARSSDAIRSSLYRVKRLLVEASEPVLVPTAT